MLLSRTDAWELKPGSYMSASVTCAVVTINGQATPVAGDALVRSVGGSIVLTRFGDEPDPLG